MFKRERNTQSPKKQNRETNEGVVSFFNNSSTEFTVCKIKCETDFVAKNNDFLNFAETLTKTIHENKKLKMREQMETYLN